MVRPAKAARPASITSVDLARLMAAFGPIGVIEASCRALSSAGAEESEPTAKRNVSAEIAGANEEQQSSGDAEEEDVIDKVVRLYDVY